ATGVLGARRIRLYQTGCFGLAGEPPRGRAAMFKIQTLNKIATIGLEGFSRENYEIASEILNPDAILVRSADMHSMNLPTSVKAIGRAGAGVNNIPVEQCS